MKTLHKKLISIIIVLLFILSSFAVFVQAAEPDILDIKAEAAILVDGQSGKILYEKNADELLPPASMTKMMTQYLVLEAIKEGRIKWDQTTGISDYAYKISQNRGLSNVPLRQDLQYNVKELFEAMSIYSANGAAIALSELVGGSETNFVKMMNDKAAQFGLKNYKFVNVTGLNNKDLMGMHPSGTDANAENMISARDAAALAYRLINDYPEVLQVSSIPKKIFREGTKDATQMDNWNWMLPGLVYAYQGMDGLKTGSTETMGNSFTGTAKRGDMRLISVVMKAPSRTARFSETKKLMDYGFSNFSIKEIIPAGYKDPNKSLFPVSNGKYKKVDVVNQKPLSIVIKNGEEKLYEPIYEINKSLIAKDGGLVAPLKEGQAVGYLGAAYKGEMKYTYVTNDGRQKDMVEVVTTKAVKKVNWFVRMMRSIGSFFSSSFKKIINKK